MGGRAVSSFAGSSHARTAILTEGQKGRSFEAVSTVGLRGRRIEIRYSHARNCDPTDMSISPPPHPSLAHGKCLPHACNVHSLNRRPWHILAPSTGVQVKCSAFWPTYKAKSVRIRYFYALPTALQTPAAIAVLHDLRRHLHLLPSPRSPGSPRAVRRRR